MGDSGPRARRSVLVGVKAEDRAHRRRKDAAASRSEPAPRLPITRPALTAFGEADRNVDEDAVRVTDSADQIVKQRNNIPTERSARVDADVEPPRRAAVNPECGKG